jgi:hypothetical protein
MTDTVFVTKYALTAGVFQVKVIRRDDDYTKVEWENGLNKEQLFRNEFIADTFEEAMTQLHKMHDKKLADLNRAIERLNNTFPKFFFIKENE